MLSLNCQIKWPQKSLLLLVRNLFSHLVFLRILIFLKFSPSPSDSEFLLSPILFYRSPYHPTHVIASLYYLIFCEIAPHLLPENHQPMSVHLYKIFTEVFKKKKKKRKVLKWQHCKM